MNKTELISVIALKSGLTKADSERALKAFEESVTEELLNGGKVQLVGFVTFEVVDKPERIGRNPSTGDSIQIAAKKSPKIKAGKSLKDAVNGNK